MFTLTENNTSAGRVRRISPFDIMEGSLTLMSVVVTNLPSLCAFPLRLPFRSCDSTNGGERRSRLYSPAMCFTSLTGCVHVAMRTLASGAPLWMSIVHVNESGYGQLGK